MKKDEFVCDCSDIDDIIVFRKDGKFLVSRIADKTFVGKDIIHVAVWKKGDERSTYNMAYVDGKTGRSYVKRFNVTAITRDREYDLTKGTKGSKLLYFTANPNGEAEVINVQLSQGCSARKKIFDFDFGDIAIKGRSSQGNILTRYPVRKVTLKEVGKSTLGAIKVWMDEVSGRLNTDDRGNYLGAFDTGDLILAIYKNGSYELLELDMNKKFEPKELMYIKKYSADQVISAVYFEGAKERTMVKRFNIETTTNNQAYTFISEHKNSKLYFASALEKPKITYVTREKGQKIDHELDLAEFIDVKGWKALGNRLEEGKISTVKEIVPEQKEEENTEEANLKTGDTIDFDLNGNGEQKSLF
jgi:topoisomerase-4 subunit A